MFRRLRILFLLLILITVALQGWRAESRLTAWEQTIHVGVYPVAGDDSAATARFLAELDREAFADIGEWMQARTSDYGRAVLQPVSLAVAPVLPSGPPLPPRDAGMLDVALWSLQLRWWASRHDDIDGPKPDIRLFVLFHDPAQNAVLPHSTGLEKGRIGVIHAFASRAQRRQNSVVITHELLHTLGATDKYELATLQPLFPAGYAEPDREPLLPQRFAEIMAGRTPLGGGQAEIPAGLADTVIGRQTAIEIGLLPAAPY